MKDRSGTLVAEGYVECSAVLHAEHNGRTRKPMKAIETKDKWTLSHGRLKQNKTTLTNNHLHLIEGEEVDLIGLIQRRTGETQESVIQTLRDCCGC